MLSQLFLPLLTLLRYVAFFSGLPVIELVLPVVWFGLYTMLVLAMAYGYAGGMCIVLWWLVMYVHVE